MNKICKTCKIEKPLSEFYFRKDSGKYRTECKTCWKQKVKKYDIKHYKQKKYIIKQWQINNKDKLKKYKKEYYKYNKDKIKQHNQKYYENNKDILKIKRKIYKNNNKNKILEYNRRYTKNKYKNDLIFKVKLNVSRKILKELKKNNSSKHNNSCLNYLPFTIEELKNHLESQFEPWMTWKNHGVYNSETWNDNDQSTWTWQIDHIIPQSDLPYSSMEDENFQKCWQLNNLRPLSAKQNLLDGVNKTRHMI